MFAFAWHSDLGRTSFAADAAVGGGVKVGEAAARAALAASGYTVTDQRWEVRLLQQCHDDVVEGMGGADMLALRGKPGGAVIFYNQLPSKHVDPTTAHGGCHVLRGAKHSANIWAWNECRSEAEIDAAGNCLTQSAPQGAPR